MARTKLAVLFSIVALLAFFEAANGAARAFSKDGKDFAMKHFRSLNIGIEWDRWLVNLAGASTDCADVGRQGPVTITKRSMTPDGQSFAGFVDSTPGDGKDADSVSKYIDTVVGAWSSRFNIRSQIEQARKVGCAVRPGCRRNALVVCVFSPAVGQSGFQQPDRYNNQPVDPRYQPGNPVGEDRYGYQPVDPRYNQPQPGREEDTFRIQPVDPRYNNQPNRAEDRYSNQPVDPRYGNQPGREEDRFSIQPVDPRYNNQPNREEDRFSIQPVDPRYNNQPNREEDRFSIQPVDPRYNNQPNREEDRFSIQPVDPRYNNQPNREEDRFSIQPVDPRYNHQPYRDSNQPVDPRYQPHPENEEVRIQPVEPRYENQPFDPRYGNQPPNQYESRGTYGQSQPSPYSPDRRTVNYPGGQVTFEKVDDRHARHSVDAIRRREMKERHKKEKKRRRQQHEEEVDIYDRMISDAMMGDDPNAQLGNMDQDEFMHYLHKHDSARLPHAPQHLKVHKRKH